MVQEKEILGSFNNPGLTGNTYNLIEFEIVGENTFDLLNLENGTHLVRRKSENQDYNPWRNYPCSVRVQPKMSKKERKNIENDLILTFDRAENSARVSKPRIDVKDPVYGLNLTLEEQGNPGNIRKAIKMMEDKIRNFENINFETKQAQLESNISPG